VSQFVRHPRECIVRKRDRLELPDSVSKRQKTLSGQAYEALRLALEKNRSQQKRRPVRLPIDETDIGAAINDCSDDKHPAVPAMVSGDDGTSATRCLVDQDFTVTNGAADCLTSLSPVAQYTGDQQLPPEMDFGQLDSIPRAPTLSDSLVDGGILYSRDEQLFAEGDLACPLEQFLTGGAMMQRAPTLSDSLVDGIMVPPVPDQQVPISDLACQLDFALSSGVVAPYRQHASTPPQTGDGGDCLTSGQYSTQATGIAAQDFRLNLYC
jgi:hypothetical protein